METVVSNLENQKKNTSIKRIFLIFSILLFVVIFISGSLAFVLSMMHSVRNSIGRELVQVVEIEQSKLEASVNSEIAIALKMAGSPVIQEFFQNPGNTVLKKIAFEEIAGYRYAFKGKSVFWVNDKDHLFYSDDNAPFKLDVKDPNNYWYLMTLNETEKYNFNINYNPDLKVTNLWINAPVFNSRHEPIGILGTGIDLTSFISSIYENYSGKADLYFFNAAGEITGALDPSLVAKKVNIRSMLGEVGDKIFSEASSLRNSEIRSINTGEGEAGIGKITTLGWYTVALFNVTLGDILRDSMTVVFLAVMAVIALILAIFYALISWLLKPLNNMVTAFL